MQSREFKSSMPYILLGIGISVGIGSAAFLKNFIKPELAKKLKNKSMEEKQAYIEKASQSELQQSLPTLESLIEIIKQWPKLKDFHIQILQKLGTDFINAKIQDEQDLGKIAHALYLPQDKSVLMKMMGRDKIMQIFENPNALNYLRHTKHGFWHSNEIEILFSMMTDDDLRKVISNHDQLAIIYSHVPVSYLNQRLGQLHIQNILRNAPPNSFPNLKDYEYRNCELKKALDKALKEKEDKRDEFTKSYDETSFPYKKVFSDLGFSSQEAGAILAFHRLFYCAYHGIDFNFEMNTDVTERAEALQNIKKFFDPNNFRDEFEQHCCGEDGSYYEDITYRNFPSSDSLEKRHEKLIKIAEILKVEISKDIKDYDTNIPKIASAVQTPLEKNYLKLRARYNSTEEVTADAKDADKERQSCRRWYLN